MLIPGTALLVNGAGYPRRGDRARRARCTTSRSEIGRDYGDQVEVLDGLDPADVIATALPSGVPDGAKVQERPAGERQRRIVMMKMTASSRIMTAMKKPEKVRKPETLAFTPPMSVFSSSSCWRRLDVST